MSYHFFTSPNKKHPHTTIWEIFGDRAIRLAWPNAENDKHANCIAKPGQPIIETICDLLKNIGLEGYSHWPLTLDPCQYYPRMARPPDQHPQQFPGKYPGSNDDAHAIAMSLGQLNVLTRQLEEICQTVHPAPNTLETYGHAIRNLLILACTEVESHWRGVLVENGLKKNSYKTSDYVQLLVAMQLDKYSLDFPSYPWLSTKRPFQGWNSTTPTQSLGWYDAYNAVKHDREQSFHRATLAHAFDAVGACAIMMLAQYGDSISNWNDSNPARFFSINERPVWNLSEVYTIDYKNSDAENERWNPVSYPFYR